jgi:hypothetical protein
MNPAVIPFLSNTVSNESRLENALLAIDLFSIIPLYGVRTESGGFRCECAKPECSAAGKHPRLKDWLTSGTCDEAVVRSWAARWPDMNFGGVTGRNIAIDVDRKGDINGAAHFEELFDDEMENVPWTVQAITGSSDDNHRCGHHYFSAASSWIGNSSKIVPGVDVRGYGGMVVLPGSRHISGRLYRWAEDASPRETGIVPIPALLLRLLNTAEGNLTASDGNRKKGLQTKSGRTKKKRVFSKLELDFEKVLRDGHGIDVREFRIREDIQPPEWKLKKLFSRRKKNHRIIMATWNRNRANGEYSLRDSSPSAYEMALAVYAACNKWTPQEISSLLVRWRCRHNLPLMKLHHRRVYLTLCNAYRVAIERGSIRKKPGKIGALRTYLSLVRDNPLRPPDIDIDRIACEFKVKRETVIRTMRRLKPSMTAKPRSVASSRAA